ncbi:hypothetical protein FT663_00206 [Candidozyma haemuli var. vulneris]|uniref:RNA polymerase II subunit A C-terminal domain phosphatase n=1 Tax=Candidozyma haemuli TaxID=45357 RepID=A0A2V1APX4_9ASCO|nr:hypothetical protein CXQ85_003612 [[Candida] haemuloni]KAF3993536.1 hypothetical protein FT662_00456 [[Candida] haemuloni var. vulneris]KAF3995610.1 hypothetical protein FT663_00206 [[Candida] haemuloni var. vulneris]PVH19754.1 hypothetical protein CXQ85_003612 [[Candida] haemuloni]
MTTVSLPPSAPFPVTVTAITARPGETISRYAPLIKYRYWDYQEDPNSKEETPPKIRVERIGSFESPIEGEITEVAVDVGEEITHSGVILCSIQEPCTHDVQYGGLCALCGKAVEDEKDYTGYNYEDRATIAMSHDNTGLRISYDEATKIEHNATERLAKEKKLILVVDLDQTVIHATVDPTVGEWQKDPQNPNYPFVKDVQSFCLEEEPMVPPGWMGPRPAPTKCWYYVKLRPGLKEFLANVAERYELHIYTMATRNYALAIASIIDPKGIYFGDRILSRDESGSLTHKNLKRLFPVDQSMVVIIDDRGDVWQWDPNLIKVVPYDFFVGIGDINSSFLPKKNGQLVGPTKKRKSLARLEEAMGDDDTSANKPVEVDERLTQNSTQESDSMDDGSESEPESSQPPEQEKDQTTDNTKNGSESSASPPSGSSSPSDDSAESDSHESDSESSSPVDRMVDLAGGENNKNLLLEQSITRTQNLEQQQHDRPLAKLQDKMDRIAHDHEDSSVSSKDEEEEHILYDDDAELITLEKALNYIHDQYYKSYDIFKKNQALERPDLTTIIPRLKLDCLNGIVVLLSGILPLGMNMNNADIVIWCRQFGMKVVNEVYPEVTHVVCRDPNASYMKTGLTLKVRIAKKTVPDVKVVNPDWLFACLSSWKKVEERDYLIELPDQDWYVSENDVTKYQTALGSQQEREEARSAAAENRPRQGSLSSIDDYDFSEANAEVDDFLAGISDDDEDGEDYEAEGDERSGEDDSAVNGSGGAGVSFVKSLYSNKRKAPEDEEDEEDSAEEDASDNYSNGDYKRQKIEAHEGDNIDELEKELLDELDNLDE